MLLSVSPSRVLATIRHLAGNLAGNVASIVAPPPAPVHLNRLSTDVLSPEKQAQYRSCLGSDAPFAWDTFSAAEADLKKRAPRNGGFALIIRSGTGSASKTSRALEKSKTDGGTELDLSALNKYGFFSLDCSCAGVATSTGTGERASSTGKTDCPFVINMSRSANDVGNTPNPVVLLSTSIFVHNHDLLESQEALLLRSAREIPVELQPTLTRLLATRPALTETQIFDCLVKEAKEQKVDVTFNRGDVRQASYLSRGNHAEGDADRAVKLLTKLASEGHLTFDAKYDDDNRLLSLVWQTTRQVRALRKRGGAGRGLCSQFSIPAPPPQAQAAPTPHPSQMSPYLPPPPPPPLPIHYPQPSHVFLAENRGARHFC